MNNLNALYPANSGSPSANYTWGNARDITISGDNTGTPFTAALQNDIIGLQQYLLKEANIVPSGSPDNVVVNQQFEAMWNILNMRTLTHNVTTDADYTLLTLENLRKRYVITDTNPFLTIPRNIIVDNIQKRFIAENNTLQTLTFKTSGGTGIVIESGSFKDLYCDGVNVIDVGTGSEIGAEEILHLQYQQLSGVNGGDITTGHNTIPFNAELENSITGAIMGGAGAITLPAGTYEVYGSNTMFQTVSTKSRLRIPIDNLTIANGYSSRSGGGETTTVLPILDDRFTIASTKIIEYQAYSSVSETNGLGTATGNGDTEVYGSIKFKKVA